MRAGAYDKPLRTAHLNLDIVLGSWIRYPPTAEASRDTEPDRLRHTGDNKANNLPDSDYKSELDDIGRDLDAFPDDITYDSDAEVLDDGTSASSSNQTYYPGAGEPIGDVSGYREEQEDLSEDPWAPFAGAHDFKLASWFIQSKVAKSRINDYFASGLGTSSTAFSSMHTLENHLQHVDPYGPYLAWFEGKVEDGKRTLPFFYRDVLGCVRYLLRQIAYRDDLVYAPRREYDEDGNRIYSEMHTADWWWGVQVLHTSSSSQALSRTHRLT